MPRARAYSRYLYRDRHKRRYTLTSTKLIVGFLVSLIGSVFVGSYFERYGPVILEQSMTALRAIFSDESEPERAAEPAPAPAQPAHTHSPSGEGGSDISSLHKRVKNIPVNPTRQIHEPAGETPAEERQ